MANNVYELPRKLEWVEVETYVGRVRGTQLWTKVERIEGKSEYLWTAWNGPILVNSSTSDSMLAARKAAEEALETGVLVVRVIPQQGA
jgi:hypothetical protein